MKKLLWLLPALLVMASPSFAQSKAGRLDRTFAKAGKMTVLLGARPANVDAPPSWFAWAPGGKIVAAVHQTLLEYLPSGRPDRGFGVSGRVAIKPPPGMALETSGMTVDSRGRILVAGTVKPNPSSASVFVARYLPGGKLDPSFGNGGTVVTDLGLPPPPPPPDKALFPTPAVTEPAVEASGLAVDATDRPLLTGSWASGFRDCYPFTTETLIDTGYLARLSVDGSLDSSFGEDGIAADPPQERKFSPLMDGTGTLSIGTQVNCVRGSPPPLELVRVGADGALDQRFGSAGRVALPYERSLLAADRFGRPLLFSFREGPGDGLLVRLRRNGSPDKRFGQDGEVELPLEYDNRFGALASDRRGRPIFAGGVGDRVLGWRLLVGRRKRNGVADGSFGRGGKTSTSFSGEVQARQILIGGSGKILVGGTLIEGRKYGLALARYLAR
jgi:uncharacterized delta-60 repeat protein